VDEYTLHVYPLTFGTGKKLFPADKEVKLKLVEATSIPTGVVYMRYRRG
jgi:hypothetical protein